MNPVKVMEALDEMIRQKYIRNLNDKLEESAVVLNRARRQFANTETSAKTIANLIDLRATMLNVRNDMMMMMMAGSCCSETDEITRLVRRIRELKSHETLEPNDAIAILGASYEQRRWIELSNRILKTTSLFYFIEDCGVIGGSSGDKGEKRV